MGLLDAIPGLAAHQSEPAGAEPEFDLELAYRLIKEAQGLVGSMYPDGALEWLRQNRPEVVKYLGDAGNEVDAAVLAGDMARFRRSLDLWAVAHRKAFAVYNERPGVMMCGDSGETI